jgi:hypothetical protein
VGGCGWVCVPPNGWNLTEISVRSILRPTQGNFDAEPPRSAEFSKGSPASHRQASARLMTDWDSALETHFHPSGLPVGVILSSCCGCVCVVFPRESLNLNRVGGRLVALRAMRARITRALRPAASGQAAEPSGIQHSVAFTSACRPTGALRMVSSATSAASTALREARLHLLHSRLDEAAAASLRGLGVPDERLRLASGSGWADTLAELSPECVRHAAVAPAEQTQLSCILVQCTSRQGSVDVALGAVRALYGGGDHGDDGGDVGASSAPVEVVLSLVHALVGAGRREEAERCLRARITYGGGGQPQRKKKGGIARADAALLVEYLLFHLLCAEVRQCGGGSVGYLA